jgi:N-acetylmuramoyl-L-alanine amidase
MGKKIYIFCAVFLALAFGGALSVSALTLYYDGGAHEYTASIFSLRVNGRLLQADPPPVVFEDRALVPARAVFEALGAAVDWNAETALATVTLDGTVVQLKIGSNLAYVDNEIRPLEAPPKIINDRTMIPVRFVSEALGFGVDFWPDSDTIVVNAPPASAAPSLTTAPSAEQTAEILGAVFTYDEENALGVLRVSRTGALRVEESVYENPLRYVVDLYGAPAKQISDVEVNKGNLQRVRFGAQTENQMRAVFDLTEDLGHWYESTDDALLIYVKIDPDGAPRSVLDQIKIEGKGISDVLTTRLTVENARLTDERLAEFTVLFDASESARFQPERRDAGAAVFAREIIFTPGENGRGTVRVELKNPAANVSLQTRDGENIITIEPDYGKIARAVVLDPGHGGRDPGAIGWKDGVRDGAAELNEKDANLAIALKTREILEAGGVTVYMTRDTDVFVELYDIPKISNEIHPLLFVSIHNNSIEDPSVSGSMVLTFLSGGPDVNGMTGRRLAENLLSCLLAQTGAENKNVRDGKNLVVIKYNEAPAALVEVGFLTNAEERARLLDDEYRQKAAQGIADGILKSLGETLS